MDIADEMIRSARQLNGEYPVIEFIVNDTDNLTSSSRRGSTSCTPVSCSSTSRMLPRSSATLASSRSSFVRAALSCSSFRPLSPSDIASSHGVVRTRCCGALASPPVLLRSRPGLHPIRMSALPETAVVAVLHAGAHVLAIYREEIEASGSQATRTGPPGSDRRMRIGLLTNFWYVRGGLERVVFGDARGLEQRGHVVLPFASAHDLNEPADTAGDFFRRNVEHGSLGYGWASASVARPPFASSTTATPPTRSPDTPTPAGPTWCTSMALPDSSPRACWNEPRLAVSRRS